MDELPLTTGRLSNGHFSKGNTYARGHAHPQAAVVFELKQALLDAVSAEDIRRCTERLLELCADSNKRIALAAIELLFDRVLGRATQPVQMDVNQQAATFPDPSTLTPFEVEAIQAILSTRSGDESKTR